MKHVKFFSFLWAGLLAAGMAGCSDDESVAEGGATSTARAYISISVSIPNGNAATKAGDDTTMVADTRSTTDGYGSDDTYEGGTEGEYAVKDALLVLFPATGDGSPVTAYFTTMTQNAGTPSGDTYDGNKISYTSEAKMVASGMYRAYLLVNTGDLSTATDFPTTEIGFQNYVLTKGITSDDGLSSYNLADNGIVMSARKVQGAESGKHSIYEEVTLSASQHTANNPLQLTMTVERAFAKVSIANGSRLSFDEVKSNADADVTIAKVELQACALFNRANSYYAFRHVGTESGFTATDATTSSAVFGKVDETNKYVIDPQTDTKKATGSGASLALAGLTPGLYVPDWNSTSPSPWTNLTANTTGSLDNHCLLGYCLENTMYANNQLKGYATGVVFQAKVTPASGHYYVMNAGQSSVKTDTYTDGTDVYYYNNDFYGSLEAVKTRNNLPSTVTESNRQDHHIYKYTGGVCYYRAYIPHSPSATQNDVMEYAIVRNNSYYLKVTGVTLPGDEGPDVPDDDDTEKVETENAYIQMSLTVAPWVVRTTDITLGN